jgi:hypothetical protein
MLDIKSALMQEFQTIRTVIGALNWEKNVIYPLIEILPGNADRAVYVGTGGVAKEKMAFTVIYANRGVFSQAEELEKTNAEAADQIVTLFRNRNATIEGRRVIYQVPGYSLERVLVESKDHYVVAAAIEIQIETVR